MDSSKSNYILYGVVRDKSLRAVTEYYLDRQGSILFYVDDSVAEDSLSTTTLYNGDRCYIYNVWIYVWSVAGIVCIRIAHQASHLRQVCAVCLHSFAIDLFLLRLCGRRDMGVSVWL